MIDSPEEIALAELHEHQRAMGMSFTNPYAPVAPMPGHGPDEVFR